MSHDHSKKQVLDNLQGWVRSGHLSREEVLHALDEVQPAAKPEKHHHAGSPNGIMKLSATQVLYYVGGLILFGAFMALLVESFDSMSPFVRIALPGFVGASLWALAWSFLRRSSDRENTAEFTDALMLTGSLCLITAAVIVGGEIYNNTGNDSGGIAVLLALVLTVLHYGYDYLAKRPLISLLFAWLAAGTYGLLVGWLFGDRVVDVPELSALFAIVGGVLLLGFGHVFAHGSLEHRKDARTPLWGLGGLLIIGSLFGLSLAGRPLLLWQLLFPVVIYSAFLLSIKARNQSFLFTGAFFLIAYIISLVVRYLSGGAVAAGLLVAAVGVLASGYLVARIRKKYF